MNQTSILTCAHIRVRASSGRTDAFLAQLQAFVCRLFDSAGSFDYAELRLCAGNDSREFFWMGEEAPVSDDSLPQFFSAAEIDVHLNLSGETDFLAAGLSCLTDCLKDGELRDCAHMSVLKTGDDFACLTIAGMHDGSYLCAEVPFADGCKGVPADMCWNSCTHRAVFHFPEENIDDAWDLSEMLPERIDEIDFEFSFDSGELRIHSVQLPDMSCAETYRAALEQFAGMADEFRIDGVLTPESDSAFALMRFAADGGRIAIQTAAAEF